MTQPIDALIFDMDGTLWDAVDSYCAVWDATFAQLGVTRPRVERDELLRLMGKPLAEIYDTIALGNRECHDRFLERLSENEREMMPRLGGRLYPGVKQTLDKLRDAGIKLFMVSNCSADGLDNFLDFTGLRAYFADALSFGATGVDKDVNLRHLKDCYNLRRPVYVGDIQRDCDATHAAGMEFAWAAYGFGTAAAADFQIDSFDQLQDLIYAK